MYIVPPEHFTIKEDFLNAAKLVGEAYHLGLPLVDRLYRNYSRRFNQDKDSHDRNSQGTTRLNPNPSEFSKPMFFAWELR